MSMFAAMCNIEWMHVISPLNAELTRTIRSDELSFEAEAMPTPPMHRTTANPISNPGWLWLSLMLALELSCFTALFHEETTLPSGNKSTNCPIS